MGSLLQRSTYADKLLRILVAGRGVNELQQKALMATLAKSNLLVSTKLDFGKETECCQKRMRHLLC